ncbi:YhcN/YlaJ family sporulation lipoprotein [Paenibacillus sp. P96]|uniref:YhcN/YlaJ family sporulation lipoprotein n=1 Tax=Paenibacillus zeirhizosphaerae TaxID=2987519 RepID=A0ABT9FLX6_9BACL|nr:YhcN/YlaJ family sporulation lipoprotein [Paenibacillus sp. P96]MDP4095725.1 YhcN/YlaJ family sporulation lipoprotein [Paenibacillus sp. P96]
MPGAKKVITVSVSAALIASMLGIAGCGYRDNGNGVRTNNIRYGAADMNRADRLGVKPTDTANRLGRDGVATNHADNMRYSQNLSKRISEMRGIRNATVLVNNNSAYVALSLVGQRVTKATTRERVTDLGNMGVRDIVGTRAPYTTSGVAPGLTGNTNGVVPRRSVADNNGLNGSSGTGTLPNRIQNQVTYKVKQYAPHIKNVYVSNDPNFVTRMGGYARDLGNGLPFSRIGRDFRMMTERLFPAGTGVDGIGPRPGVINRGNSTLNGNR